MALGTRNISILHNEPSGKTVVFKFIPVLTGGDDEVLLQKEYKFSVPAGEETIVELPVKSEGSIKYKLVVPTFRGDETKTFYLASGVDCSLADLIAAGGANTDSVQDWVNEQLANIDLSSKVSVADVVNDLLQTTPGKVLDARQGKTLKDLIDAGVTSANAYTDSAIFSVVRDAGDYDASTNLFPAAGTGTGSAGAIRKGDSYLISVAGTLGGVAVEIGDVVRAKIAVPGQTASNWIITERNLGFVPENSANKSTDGTFAANSDTLFPTQKAVKTGLDLKAALAGANFTGSIGINTANPRRLLDILNTAAPQLRLTYTDNSVYNEFQTQSDGKLTILSSLTNPIVTFGGITSSFAALKRSGANLQARLGDDSNYTGLAANNVTLLNNTTQIGYWSDTGIYTTSAGIKFSNSTSNMTTQDAGLSRLASGVVKVNDGSTGFGKLAVSNSTPTGSTDAGTAQTIWADANYVYVQTGASTIKRIALTTF